MTKKVTGSLYTATIDKTNVVALDGTPLNFRIDITCEESILFKELIAYIDDFHRDIPKSDDSEWVKRNG